MLLQALSMYLKTKGDSTGPRGTSSCSSESQVCTFQLLPCAYSCTALGQVPVIHIVPKCYNELSLPLVLDRVPSPEYSIFSALRPCSPGSSIKVGPCNHENTIIYVYSKGNTPLGLGTNVTLHLSQYTTFLHQTSKHTPTYMYHGCKPNTVTEKE